ncbi:hypothetical protein [Prevotella sp.]|uniref:hypothetical protein n=1 Tax=Prevotella sp. TaxID=59823 RepID=UPI0026481160|nr:hypothetical protein [Prevotella sp.]MDN5552588.1 hypothetical protein [Prevotella sp.]
MQFINKAIDRTDGNQITKTYLKNIRIEDEQRYPVDYDNSFRNLPNKHDSYYKQMTKVLLKNQDNHCCYCMRRLTGDHDTTLEHIIPQAADENILSYYQQEAFPMFNNQHIKLSKVFSHEENPNLSILPHTVCYDNLVASCYGLFPIQQGESAVEDKSGHCCNNVRGNKNALPLYFLADINSILLYCTNGSIIENENSEWANEAKYLIWNTKLMWTSLVDIREMWYVLRNVDLKKIAEAGNDPISRYDLIQDNLLDADFPLKRIMDLATKFKKDKYWECFLLYDWFYSITWNTI